MPFIFEKKVKDLDTDEPNSAYLNSPSNSLLLNSADLSFRSLENSPKVSSRKRKKPQKSSYSIS